MQEGPPTVATALRGISEGEPPRERGLSSPLYSEGRCEGLCEGCCEGMWRRECEGDSRPGS